MYWKESNILILGAIVAGGVGDFARNQFVSWGQSWPFIVPVVLLAALYIGLVAFVVKRHGWLLFTSLAFIVTALSYVIGAVVFGTVILQNLTIAAYHEHYGWLAHLILFLNLNDIFHSYWFVALLFLINLSFVVYLVTDPPRKKNFVLWLVHLSLVIVSLGGFLSYTTAIKGNLNMHIGDNKNIIQLYSADRSMLTPHTLPFNVKLEDFDIEYYPVQWRFVLVNKQTRNYRSFDLDKARVIRVDADTKIRITKVYHNHRIILEPGNGPERHSCVQFVLTRRDKQLGARWLDTKGHGVYTFAPKEAKLFLFKNRQQLLRKLKQGEHFFFLDGSRFRLQKGKTVPLKGDKSANLIKFFPDFTYNIKKKKARNRSHLPRNPAAKIALYSNGKLVHKKWYFSRRGGDKSGGPDYSYSGRMNLLQNNFVYLLQQKRFARITEEATLGSLAMDSLDYRYYQLTAKKEKSACLLQEKIIKKQGNPENPSSIKIPIYIIKLVSLSDGGGSGYGIEKSASREHIVTYRKGYNMLPIDSKITGFVKASQNEPKNYHSLIGIYENGTLVKRRRIKVNEPLIYKGYWIYQANYNAKDPTFSGLLVVRDRGVYVAYAGLVLLGLSLAAHFFQHRVKVGYDA